MQTFLVSKIASFTKTMVISDRGEWFNVNDKRLAETIGFSDPHIDAVGYAVRNMGFIRFSQSRHPLQCVVTLHPRNFEAQSVDATTKHLAAQGSGTFTVEFLNNDNWVTETYESGEDAAFAID